MTKNDPSSKRNVEIIRRKNVEENQIFLQKLLMTDIRNEFLNTARSFLRKNGNNEMKKKLNLQIQKVEHATRYNEKVKSGEIAPFVPEWQRLQEEKKKETQRRLLEREQQKLAIQLKKEQYEIKKQEMLFEKELRQIERELKQQEYEIKKQEILYERELRQIERQLILEGLLKGKLTRRRRSPKPSRWTLFYKNNPDPYGRTFKPRHTKVGERAETAHDELF